MHAKPLDPKQYPGHTPRVALVTGGAGFIGSNLVHHLLASDPALKVVVYDVLTYAGNPANLAGLAERHGARFAFVKADICDQAAVDQALAQYAVDTIIHLAAESHVDRSIDGPGVFVQTNVMGTFTLLTAARKAWGTRQDVRFHHVSTD
jgi:dTDP-glucose 4,6-dehydratase